MDTGIRYRFAWLAHALATSRNPLRRRVDRLTAVAMLILIVLAAAAIPAAVFFGSDLHQQQARVAAAEAAQRYQVPAVLTANPQTSAPGDGPDGQRPVTDASVRWTDRNGQGHLGVVQVPSDTVQGRTVPVWVGPSGELTPPPRTEAEVTGSAVFETIMGLAAATICCSLLAAGVRGLADAHARRAWAREWEIVERRWTQPHQ